jgi:hypothetical protein
MREFEDENGRAWVADVAERGGPNYKSRFHLVMRPADGDLDDAVDLVDVRWNSARTAARTLATASVVELRRRLRDARGRKPADLVPPA